MKLTLVFLLLTLSLNLFGRTKQGNEVDPSLDHIGLQDEINVNPSVLVIPLELYANKDLHGNPIFIIEKDRIISKLTHEKKDYIFSNHFKRNPKGENHKVVPIPIDFISLLPEGYAVALDEYKFKDEIARVTHEKKFYYFKMTEKNFSRGWPWAHLWARTKNSWAAINFIKENENDPLLSKELKNFRTCIIQKNEACLLNFSGASKRLKTDLDTLSIARSKILCDKLKKENLNVEDPALVSLLDHRYVPWELFQRVSKFDSADEDVKYELRNSSFEDSIELTIRLEGQSFCNESYLEEIELNVIYQKKQNEWKIYVQQAMGYN